MKKGKAVTLLSIICFVMAVIAVMTFVRFGVGVKNYNSVLGAIELDYDLDGGTAYVLTLAKDNVEEVEDVDEVLKTIESRLYSLGYQSMSVKAVKSTDNAIEDYDIRIEARGVTNDYGEQDVSTLSQDVAVAAAYGELAFFGGTEASPSTEILTDMQVIKSAEYTGSYTGAADASGNSTTYYTVTVTFTDEAYEEIEKQMAAGTFYLKVMLGETTLMSGSDALSSTYFQNKSLGLNVANEAGAKQAALQISSGGLAYKYEISEGVSVSSPFGENVAVKCVIIVAALVIIAVAVFIALYKGYGIIAGLTLILFILLNTLLLIAVPGLKLSLGGVIGIILACALTIDGLAIIAKRVSEEFSNGKMVKTAVKNGFRRASVPIAGTVVVSAIFALLLFALTKGTLQGFAATFGIGVAVSMLSTLLFSRMFALLVLASANYSENFLGLKKLTDDKATEVKEAE